MYAPPITDRIKRFLSKKTDIFRLFDMKWNDTSIAMYISSDTKTIRRFRAAYREFGTNPTDEQILSKAAVK